MIGQLTRSNIASCRLDISVSAPPQLSQIRTYIFPALFAKGDKFQFSESLSSFQTASAALQIPVSY